MKNSDGRSEAAHAVRAAIVSSGLTRATLHAKPGRADWQRAILRPVHVRGQARVQVSLWDGTQDRTSNLGADELSKVLDTLLSDDWQRIHIVSTEHDLHVRVTKKGKVLLHTSPSSAKDGAPTAHDRAKDRVLDPFSAGEVLRALGVANAMWQIRPSMRAKYRQIESFCRIIDQAVTNALPGDRPVRVVDCGCGSAYLTFAAYHVLSKVRGREVQVEGVDTNAGLIAKVRRQAQQLGWDDMAFRVASIADVQPDAAPNVVLSLHACDTATDEALARGVAWGSELILSAPCCQHELHNQLHDATFRPVLRHGILRERMADILTDSLRALALRIMGYRATVVEFVDPAHTSRNIMIQAEKGLPVGDPRLVAEYLALTGYWGVEPIIARLLGEPFSKALGDLHKA